MSSCHTAVLALKASRVEATSSMYQFAHQLQSELGITTAPSSLLRSLAQVVSDSGGCPVSAGKDLMGKLKLYAQYAAIRQRNLAALDSTIEGLEADCAVQAAAPLPSPSNGIEVYRRLRSACEAAVDALADELFPGMSRYPWERGIDQTFATVKSEREGLFNLGFSSAMDRSIQLGLALAAQLDEPLREPSCFWSVMHNSIQAFNRIVSRLHIELEPGVSQLLMRQVGYLLGAPAAEKDAKRVATLTFKMHGRARSAICLPQLTVEGENLLRASATLRMHKAKDSSAVGCPIRLMGKDPNAMPDKISHLATLLLRREYMRELMRTQATLAPDAEIPELDQSCLPRRERAVG